MCYSAARMDPHRRAEVRSLAYHRAIAARLQGDARVIDDARRRVAAWLAQPQPPAEARAWAALLQRGVDEIARAILADSESARALRQSTPFAGVLSPAERWAIWRATRAGAGPPP